MSAIVCLFLLGCFLQLSTFFLQHLFPLLLFFGFTMLFFFVLSEFVILFLTFFFLSGCVCFIFYILSTYRLLVMTLNKKKWAVLGDGNENIQ